MENILSCISECDLWFAIVALCLIVADIISGVMKGYATRTLSSEKMRTGFWHKSANVFLLFLAYSATVANAFIEGMPEWTQSVYVFASGYIAVMELTSILQTLVNATIS